MSSHRNIMIDTEFMEAGRNDRLRLLSIALVAEDGATYYAETTEDRSLANDWVKEHVLPQLKGPIKSYEAIRDDILAFVGPDKFRSYGYYCDYDWVLLCGIFGRMVDLPRHFPKYCRDLKQTASELGIEAFPEQPADEHHALADARWNLQLYKMLKAAAPAGLDL